MSAVLKMEETISVPDRKQSVAFPNIEIKVSDLLPPTDTNEE